MLLDLSHELCDIDTQFEENEKVSNLKTLLQELGKCSVVRSSVICATIDTEPIYSGEVLLTTNTELEDHDSAGGKVGIEDESHTGDKIPIFTSFDKLSDGRQLLIDQANKKVKLYDQNNILVTEHILSVSSDNNMSHVVVLSNTEAVVSTCTNTPHKVTIGGDLSVTETKSTHLIGPIIKCGEDVIAILKVNNIIQISVLDKALTIKKTIIKDDKKLFRLPVFLAASDDKSMLFVADYFNGCFGFTIDGHVRFHYQDHDARSYGGLAVGRDCLFLGVRDENGEDHVHKLNFEGGRVACTEFGRACPLRMVDNELVLFTEDWKSNRMINFYFLFQ